MVHHHGILDIPQCNFKPFPTVEVQTVHLIVEYTINFLLIFLNIN